MNGVRNLKFVDGRSELVATYYGRYCRLMDGLIGRLISRQTRDPFGRFFWRTVTHKLAAGASNSKRRTDVRSSGGKF